MSVSLKPLPMTEAQQFWRDKVKMGPKEFSRLADEAKLKAFAVSGIAKGDELDTVFNAMERAIDEGISFEAFKKECGDIFERRGWTGKRAWRVDNIFRTNIQTAYNVGQYKQMWEDRAARPYWQYSAINDSRTRPTHLAMDNRVWPADHPTWDIWYPPNGYRCRCAVISLSKSQVERRGIKVEDVDPTNKLIEPIDPGTGNRMPARQLIPDPGFNFNPGKAYWEGLGELLTERLERYPEQLAQAVLKDFVQDAAFAALVAAPRGNVPVLRITEDAAAAIGAQVRVAVFSQESMLKNIEHHPELTVADYRMLPSFGSAPQLVIQTRESTVALIKIEGAWYLAAVKATGSGGELYVTSFRKTNSKDVESLKKSGKVIFEEK